MIQNPHIEPPLIDFGEELALSQLQEMQRLAEIGRLSASLLHQISNPLAAALLHLEQVSNQVSPGLRHVRRNIRLLRRYVEAARQQLRQESRPVKFSVRQQLEQVSRIVMPSARSVGVDLLIETLPGCRLFGDPIKFQHVMTNLIMNAIDAYEGDTTTALARPVRVTMRRQRHSLTIKVIDWGKGITLEQLEHLFKPFYTTKSQGGYGLGIGLAIVEHYTRQDFKGSITVTSSRRHGTQFILRLPLQ
jgi:signal transduction histidine kinase